MKVVFDTSVLVAALVVPHPLHERALKWLERARAGEVEYLVAGHTLAELYAVLTSLPVSPRISPSMAWQLIDENVTRAATLIPLSITDYRVTIQRGADQGWGGGVIYDALLAQAAYKVRAQVVLTFNLDDFKRVWPGAAKALHTP